MNDPEDWRNNLQIINDILSSNGIPGEGHMSTEQKVPIVFSNPDFLWAAGFVWPRFAQGAFRKCVETLYLQSTGKQLNSIQYGKPEKTTFAFIESMLLSQAKEYGSSGVNPIYMIGDNPQSDVKGANNAGAPWISVLVKTGIYTGHNSSDHQTHAKMVFNDVLEATGWILHQHQTNPNYL